MNAPIRDFVRRYAQSEAARLHMPGHKGRGPLGCEALDITEIRGADALYEAEGIIAQSEANATALFETQRTLYSTEGSSQCIRAMLHLALCAWREDRFSKATTVFSDRQGSGNVSAVQTLVCSNPRPVALAGRNAHRAFLTAAALDDFDVEWLWPEIETNSPCACPISAEGLARALRRMEQAPFCVYLTSPDYLGGMLDIEALAKVCHAQGIPLLVDNAHGAYLKFLPERAHPMELGADMCCDSAHKTLPVLTGGAYLHIGKDSDARYAENAKRAMALFGSTSPSYLILQSLDCANLALAGDFPQQLATCRKRLDALKANLTARGFAVLPTEPMKLTLHTDGAQTAAMLRGDNYRLWSVNDDCVTTDYSLNYGNINKPKSATIGSSIAESPTSPGNIEPEYVDREHIVLMFSPSNTPEDFARVDRALLAPPSFIPAPALPLSPPPREMTIRAAMFAPCEQISLYLAEGRICGAALSPCPPAISVAVPGERITSELIALLQRSGINKLSVVRQP